MAGSSLYPQQKDNYIEVQDGIDIIQADDVNDSYAAHGTMQTFVGITGKAQSWSTDILDVLLNGAAPLCTKASASSISVSAGSLMIGNSGQSVRLPIRNSVAIPVTAANLDTGAMAVGFYDIYAIADASGAAFTIKFCLRGNTPSGASQYEFIGWFYNETPAALDVTNGYVGNVKRNGRDVPNGLTVVGTTDISTASTSYVDMTDMTIKFYSTGRPVLIMFQADFDTSSQATQFVGIAVDGVSKATNKLTTVDVEIVPMSVHYLESLAAGSHSITAQWKAGSAANAKQNGSADAPRRLTVIEL